MLHRGTGQPATLTRVIGGQAAPAVEQPGGAVTEPPVQLVQLPSADGDPGDVLALDGEHRPVWVAPTSTGGGVSRIELDTAISDALATLSAGGSIFLGEGPPPDLIPGVKVGDVYVNTATGDLYRLETGV